MSLRSSALCMEVGRQEAETPLCSGDEFQVNPEICKSYPFCDECG